MLMANPERGEVLLKLGSKSVVLCFEFKRLATFSGMIKAKSISDVFGVLRGSEPNAMVAFIHAFTVDGDPEELVAEIKNIRDFATVSEAAIRVLNVFVGDDPKKDESGVEERADQVPTDLFHSANG